ncbi:unnamed protein product, partial [Rotaria magnacalcarata]
MSRGLKLICLNHGNNLQKDGYDLYTYARGFDDFVTAWPPSTNTTSIDDS